MGAFYLDKQIGLGIHGEAGIKQTGLQTADELTDVMISAIVDSKSEGELIEQRKPRTRTSPTRDWFSKYRVSRRS